MADEKIRVVIASEYDEKGADQAIADAKLIDDLSPTIDIDTTTATGNIDKLGKSADSSKSVLANMVGNASQDLGALGGVAGSAGVAIGQMGEYMADARASGEGFGSILKNFATVAGPIAALSIAMAGVNSIMQAMAKGQAAIKAFNTKQVEDFTEAVVKGGKALNNYNDTLADTGEVLANTGNKAAPAWARILPGVSDIARSLGFLGKFGDNVEDILPLLTQAGLTSENWSSVVTAGVEDQAEELDKLRVTLDAVNISEEERHKIMQAAIEAQDNMTVALKNRRTAEEFFVPVGPAAEFGHAPAAGIAAIVEANADRRAAVVNNNIFVPPPSPAVVVDRGDSFIRLNSMRTGP